MVICHRQGAHQRHRLLLALLQERFLANEISVLDLLQRHARFDDVVLGVQLGAVGAVTLFESATRAVHTDTDGNQSVRLTRLEDHVPQLRSLPHGQVQLPAEFSDVGDARRENAKRSHLDHAAAAEREALVRHVCSGERLHDRSGVRTPHSQRRHRGGQILQLRRPVGRQVIGEPLSIRHPVRTTGDDAEMVRSQSHDRQVGAEPASRGEHRGVDHLADGNVHLTHSAGLHHVQGARPDDVEDRERRQIDHARGLAHLQMFRVDDG